MSGDHELESLPGLPGELPPGEQLLWQGRPHWRTLARRTFKGDWLALYLGVFIAVRLVVGLQRGEGLAALGAAGQALVLATVCLGIVAALAIGYSRATIYSITSERLVLRIGVAFPLNINLPFKRLASADLQSRGGDVGDIVLQLAGPDRIAWLYLWPHTHGFHVAKPRPTLLCLPRAAEAATVLRRAVEAWAQRSGAPVTLGAPVAVEPVTPAGVPALANRVSA